MASSSPSLALLASRRGWQDDGWQERALVRAAWGPGTATPKHGSAGPASLEARRRLRAARRHQAWDRCSAVKKQGSFAFLFCEPFDSS